MKRILVAMVLGLGTSFVAPTLAEACIDAGPPNGACNDGGADWIACAVHSDCPSPQRCFEGTCTCLEACPFDEECSDAGCTCVRPRNLAQSCVYDAGICEQRGRPGFVTCSDAATDASPDAPGDASSADVTQASGGCTFGGSTFGAGAGPALALLLVARALRRRRR